MLFWALLIVLLPAGAAFQQTQDPRAAEFRKRASALAEQRREGMEESQEAQEGALKILDAFVLEELNRGAARDVAALNRRLAALVTQDPPVGESYALVLLGTPPGGSGYYALVANFGQSGPSGVRLYPPSEEGYKPAARIDRYATPDFFDDYLELAPIKASDVVFITISGRADELKTGSFMAWRYRFEKLETLWASELLEHSTWENRADGFHLTYCVRADENNPRRCALMARERHVWDGSFWRQAAREEFAPK